MLFKYVDYIFNIFLGYFLFNSGIIVPDYYVCSRIVEQNFTFLNESLSFNFHIAVMRMSIF